MTLPLTTTLRRLAALAAPGLALAALIGLAGVPQAQAQAQVKARLMEGDGWVWYAPQTPRLDVAVSDSLGRAGHARLTLRITTDTHRPLCTLSQTVAYAAGDSAVATFEPPIAEPGFYHVSLEADGRGVTDNAVAQYGRTEHQDHYCIGYEPERIVSLPDAEADIDAFWAKALAELAATPIDARVTEVTERSTRAKRAYRARLIGLDGDTVQLDYTVPTRRGRYPVHIINMGYNSEPWDLDMGDPTWIDVIVSSRGQGRNKPHNRYGDWVQHGLQSPDTYYYRGAYLDCVRAIDYITTLPQADTTAICLEGGSQGAAYSLACAALDPRVKVIAVYIPFMNDWPDYLQIAPWPASAIGEAQRRLGLSDAEVLRTLSYFDIKNLARRITCPVYMGVGLQDPTCPPHTNFAGFNLIRAPKEYHIYPHHGHHVDYAHWNPALQAWYRRWL